MIVALLVGAASGGGAVARYVMDLVIQRRLTTTFPFGTLTVNLVGSTLLGLVTGLAVHHGLPTGPTAVFSAGFCSGFTTWSTFIWETLALRERGYLLAAVGYFTGSLAAGLAAAAAGYGIGLL